VIGWEGLYTPTEHARPPSGHKAPPTIHRSSLFVLFVLFVANLCWVSALPTRAPDPRPEVTGYLVGRALRPTFWAGVVVVADAAGVSGVKPDLKEIGRAGGRSFFIAATTERRPPRDWVGGALRPD